MIGERKALTFLATSHVRWTLGWALLDAGIMLATYVVLLLVLAAAVPIDYSFFPGFIIFVISVMLVMNYVFGVYRRIWSRTSGHEVGVLLKAGSMATLVSLGAGALVSNTQSLPLGVIILVNGLSVVGFVLVRYRGRLLSGFVWRWRAIWYHEFPVRATPVLIVGAGQLGQNTAWRLKYGGPADVKYCVVGFVDDDCVKHGMYVEGCRVLGDCKAIPRLVKQHQIELIVIALQTHSGSRFREILSCCERTDARIQVMQDIFEVLNRKQGVPFLRDVEPEDFLDRKPVGHHPSVNLGPVRHKVILVTGAAGSIGSELSRQLLDLEPVRLLLIDNNESDLHDLAVCIGDRYPAVANCVVPILSDVTDYEEMKQIFEEHKPEVVFHSAAYKHVPMLEHYPNKAAAINVNGTRCVAELSRTYAVERFVLISSDKAVCPANIMGATKRICELLMLAMSQLHTDTLFTAVRFGNVLGSRGSVMPIFNRQIDAGGPVTITDKNMRRYFMTIAEAANLVIHAACLTNGGDLFMLNMGNEIRIVDLAERMIRMRGLRPYEDVTIEFVGIRPGEKLYEILHAGTELPHATCHPEIFQLVDNDLKLEPREFLYQIGKLQRLQHYRDDRLRLPLMALAHLEEVQVETDSIPESIAEHTSSWLQRPAPNDDGKSQPWVRKTRNNRSHRGRSLI